MKTARVRASIVAFVVVARRLVVGDPSFVVIASVVVPVRARVRMGAV